METPEKIWINPSMDLPKLNGVIDRESVQYIRKDIVEDMLATAEVHAYFTGGESEREKLALKKDAFIEKACAFLKDRIAHDSIDYPMATNSLIEDFKRYIEK